MEFNYEIRIPKNRIAVLIGKKGEIKKQIEEIAKTKINVDSEDGFVLIKGEDAILLHNTKQVVTAISRGFNPEIATLLFKNDYCIEIININDYVKSKKSLLRIKGRLIGTKGKCRRIVEELTETHISIYGKTVAIIGWVENVAFARKAMIDLLEGSPHANVYRNLEKKRVGLRKSEFEKDDDKWLKQ